MTHPKICSTCTHWIGTANLCSVGSKQSEAWEFNSPCNQTDPFDHTLKYTRKEDTGMPNLPPNTEAVVDEVIEEIQGGEDSVADDMVARSTDRSSDCSTCQPNAPGESEAVA